MFKIEEITRMLGNPEMATAGCFWIFDDNGNASQIKHNTYLKIFEEINENLGKKAIWIRELENYSEKLRSYCQKIKSANCHMIIAPPNSTVLSRHYDIWDVYIKMLYGKRKYEIEGKHLILSAGESLLIKKGEMHQVFPLEPSITINFGVKSKETSFPSLDNPFENCNYNFNTIYDNNKFLNSFRISTQG